MREVLTISVNETPIGYIVAVKTSSFPRYVAGNMSYSAKSFGMLKLHPLLRNQKRPNNLHATDSSHMHTFASFVFLRKTLFAMELVVSNVQQTR